MANGRIEKWKVRLVSLGDLQNPGDETDITSPVIVSTSIRHCFGLAAVQMVEIAVRDIPTASSVAPSMSLFICASMKRNGRIHLAGPDPLLSGI
jgi:hypothetical protein